MLTAVGLLVGEVADDGEELLRGVAARRRRSCSHRFRGNGPWKALLEASGEGQVGRWVWVWVFFPPFDVGERWSKKMEMEWALVRSWTEA